MELINSLQHYYNRYRNCFFNIAFVLVYEQTAEGFGFNVMGGKEQKCPIYISRIIPGGYVDRLGTIHRGDQLLSINGEASMGRWVGIGKLLMWCW